MNHWCAGYSLQNSHSTVDTHVRCTPLNVTRRPATVYLLCDTSRHCGTGTCTPTPAPLRHGGSTGLEAVGRGGSAPPPARRLHPAPPHSAWRGTDPPRRQSARLLVHRGASVCRHGMSQSLSCCSWGPAAALSTRHLGRALPSRKSQTLPSSAAKNGRFLWDGPTRSRAVSTSRPACHKWRRNRVGERCRAKGGRAFCDTQG